METIPSTTDSQVASESPEVLEELPEWKVDSTFQHRVNNVCSKLIRRGVRPTYQRVRANLGEPPGRLLREALQSWTEKILPSLYSSPRVEWADRPKAISPKISELFEEMWLQAISAAQTHYELGDDSSSRLTHREIIDMVSHELRRLNTRVSCIANATQRFDQSARAHNDIAKELQADIQWFQQAFEVEIARIRDLSAAVEKLLIHVQHESERQSQAITNHLEIVHEAQRIERAKRQRILRMAAKLRGSPKRETKRQVASRTRRR